LRVKRLMDNELKLADAREEKPIIQSLITLWSFIMFGFIPLIPYMVLGPWYNYRFISIGMTTLALLLLGIVRWFITKMPFFYTIGQVFVLWAAAAAVAYWTGKIVTGL
jgi:VIT1/CCC1 family predicted Fe2+/Mn2+ transporter